MGQIWRNATSLSYKGNHKIWTVFFLILAIKDEPFDQDFEYIGESSKEETLNLRTEEDIKPVVAEAMEAQEYDTRSEAEGSDRGLLNSDVEEEDENKDESGMIYLIHLYFTLEVDHKICYFICNCKRTCHISADTTCHISVIL